MSRSKFTRRRAVNLIGVGAMVPFGACKRTSSSSSAKSSIPADFYYMSLREVARRIQSRELSPVDLTRFMLERIRKVDSGLKSFATVMSEQALADAGASLR